MGSKIAELIICALENRDERICRLYENDPLFHKAYHLLNQHGDKPEVILEILMAVCELKNETMNKLIEVTQQG
jgi:hypothetical protein